MCGRLPATLSISLQLVPSRSLAPVMSDILLTKCINIHEIFCFYCFSVMPGPSLCVCVLYHNRLLASYLCKLIALQKGADDCFAQNIHRIRRISDFLIRYFVLRPGSHRLLLLFSVGWNENAVTPTIKFKSSHVTAGLNE